MARRINVEREYVLEGIVVDRATQRGVKGVRVEAWDRDTVYHDMLGQATTDDEGHFTIGYDRAYFGDHAPDRSPDVFFKLFLDEKEVLTTFEKPQRNLAAGTTRVRLEIDLPQLRPLGKDRISAQQAFKAVDWWHASDFRGVIRESRDKTKTVGAVVGAVLGHSLKTFDFKPVVPKGATEREIVNQDKDAARRALAAQQVEVSGVKSTTDLTPGARLRSLSDYPVRLKAGDRVTLYEEDGVVKYYTRDAVPVARADEQTIARIDEDVQKVKVRVESVEGLRLELANVRSASEATAARAAEEAAIAHAQAEELERVRRELEEVRRASAHKDVQIAKLETDLTQLRGAQEDLASRVSVDRIHALEVAVAKLSRIERPPIDRSSVVEPPARPAAPATADEPKPHKKPKKRRG